MNPGLLFFSRAGRGELRALVGRLGPAALAVALSACGGTRAAPPASASPEPAPAPELARAAVDHDGPRSLAGVDTTALTPRELGLWWRVVNESLAPCAQEPVSVAQCIEQARPCAACAPAASFLAGRVARGDALRAIDAAYTARFMATPRPIEVGDSPARGPTAAPVTIVVWSDFQCPACRRAVPVIDEAYEASSGAVRLVHKFYPLRAHLRGEDAARAAIAAAAQGQYWAMERSLFEHQSALEPRDLERYASSLGLDLARFRADMASAHTTAWLARDRAAADALGLDGTPFVFVNGRPFDLRLFSLDEDLSAWIQLEVAMSAAPSARK